VGTSTEPPERYVNIVNGDSTIAQRQLRRGGYAGYEVNTAATLCALLQLVTEGRIGRPPENEPTPGPTTFFDVGSNCGHFTLLIKGLWPDTKVVAFEPTPDTHAWLSRVTRSNGMEVRTENVAVSSEEGEATLYLSSKSDSSNSLNPEFRDHKGEVVVRCITLDGFCTENSTWPQIVKIDTETFEEAVLRGSVKMMKDYRPFIVVEILEKAGTDTAARITDVVKSVGGYRFYPILGDEELVEHDAIFGAKSGRNWLLSPSALDDDFFRTMAAWKNSIARCDAPTNIVPGMKMLQGKDPSAVLARAKQARLAGDQKQALSLYEEAASLGDRSAFYWLGRAAEDKKAYFESLRFYRHGAQLNESAATRGLARAYQLGRGIIQDTLAARAWYELGVARGDWRAAMELAALVTIEENAEAGVEWYEKAAELGGDKAWYHLARFYEDKKEYDKSLAYHREGAERGELACVRGVARAYELGRGVQVDKNEAQVWAVRAEAKPAST
jgi:FkbM family methyltransferase